jgi:hypothetical protein
MQTEADCVWCSKMSKYDQISEDFTFGVFATVHTYLNFQWDVCTKTDDTTACWLGSSGASKTPALLLCRDDNFDSYLAWLCHLLSLVIR